MNFHQGVNKSRCVWVRAVRGDFSLCVNIYPRVNPTDQLFVSCAGVDWWVGGSLPLHCKRAVCFKAAENVWRERLKFHLQSSRIGPAMAPELLTVIVASGEDSKASSVGLLSNVISYWNKTTWQCL